MRIAVCDDNRAIWEELVRLIQKQVSGMDIARHIREQEKAAGKGA